MQTNLKPNSRLAKAGTLFFDYLVIFAGAVLYGCRFSHKLKKLFALNKKF